MAAAAALLATASAQAADPAAERVQLLYAAGPSCVDRASFGREVSARIHRPIEWVPATEPASRVIVVDLVEGEAKVHGSVEMRSPPPVTRREFEAASCAEVSAALSLVVALTLDPNARVDLPPAVSGEPAPANAAFPEDRAPEAAPVALAAPAASEPPKSAAAEPSPPKESPVRFSVGPVAGVSAGYAPVALITIGGAVGLRSTSDALLSPSLQLSVLWGETGKTGPSAPEASFGWTFGRVEACPIQWRLLPVLGVSPCGLLELGRLSAAGSSDDIAEPVETSRFWSSLGVSLTLLAHSGAFFTRLGLYGAAPLTRDKFSYFNPDAQLVHEPSAVVGGGVVQVGIEL